MKNVTLTELPAVAIVLYTYDRLSTAQQTLRALAAFLLYDGPLILHIADDGSPDLPEGADGEGEVAYVEELRQFAEGILLDTSDVMTTVSDRMGYGGSYNAASQVTHAYAEVLLPLEDDWELSRPFDITPLVRALQDPRVNCIRLGYIGYTQALRGEIIDVTIEGDHLGKFLLFDEDSPERHVFAGHPRLETREFQKAVGPWPERIQAGQTEFDVSGRPESRKGVVWPLDLGLPGSQRRDSLFRHIGADGKGEIDPAAE